MYFTPCRRGAAPRIPGARGGLAKSDADRRSDHVRRGLQSGRILAGALHILCCGSDRHQWHSQLHGIVHLRVCPRVRQRPAGAFFRPVGLAMHVGHEALPKARMSQGCKTQTCLTSARVALLAEFPLMSMHCNSAFKTHVLALCFLRYEAFPHLGCWCADDLCLRACRNSPVSA